MKNYIYYTYILTNYKNTVLYIGVTNNLERRLFEHKKGLITGFSKKYNLKKLIHIESFENIHDAIAREKQLKDWNRQWKFDLICKENPEFNDLSISWSDQQIPDRVWDDNEGARDYRKEVEK